MSSSPAPTTNLLSPEPQDSASNHSGHTGDSQLGDEQVLANNHQHHHDNSKRKPFKTEYKSKFTPFDQYVYNEVTDSFVKQQQQQQQQLHHQDLSSHNDQHHLTNSASQLIGVEAHVFEPSDTISQQQAQPSNNEPWYKEVIRRNEKANEYRFKAEGHNSPLLGNASNLPGADGPLSTRANSPAAFSVMTDRQLLSPGAGNGDGAESVLGDKMSSISTSDVQSQLSDQTITTDQSHQQQQHQQKRFTPNDYKRDHFIAHMANNNNFNLPKEQQRDSSSTASNLKAMPRRTTTTNSSRVGTVQARSRSQSTRRQPINSQVTANSSHSNNTSVATSKSNQTTPTRTVPRVALAASKTSTTRAPARTSTTASSGRTQHTTPTTATLRITSRTTTSTTTPTNGTSSNRVASTSARRIPASTTSSSRTVPGTTSLSRSAPRTGVSATGVGGAKASPVAAARTASRSAATSGSASKPKTTTRTTASATPPSSATTAIKSIKTPKALAAAKEAKLAAADAAAAAAAGTTSSSSTGAATAVAAAATAIGAAAIVSTGEPTGIDEKSNISSSISDQLANIEVATQKPTDISTAILQPKEALFNYQPEEPNLITTTTEAGNMLADELAQAEKVASARQQESQLFANQESPIADLHLGQSAILQSKPVQSVEKELDKVATESSQQLLAGKYSDDQPLKAEQSSMTEDVLDAQLAAPTEFTDKLAAAEVVADNLRDDILAEVGRLPLEEEIPKDHLPERKLSEDELSEELEVAECEHKEEVMKTEVPVEEYARSELPVEDIKQQVQEEKQISQVEKQVELENEGEQVTTRRESAAQLLETLQEEDSVDKRTFTVNYSDKKDNESDLEEPEALQVVAQTQSQSQVNLESVKEPTANEQDESKNLPSQEENIDGSKELVNGLADGLVSAEDRFDSSEREISSDLDDYSKHDRIDVQNYNDEPYSIMPTTASQAEAVADDEVSASGELIKGEQLLKLGGEETDLQSEDNKYCHKEDDDDHDDNNEQEKVNVSKKPVKTLSFNLSDEIIDASPNTSSENLADNRLINDIPNLMTKTNNEDFLTQQQNVAALDVDDFFTGQNATSGVLNAVEVLDANLEKTIKNDHKQVEETNINKEDEVDEEEDDEDLMNEESNDLIESSPALVSANTTLQDEPEQLDDEQQFNEQQQQQERLPLTDLLESEFKNTTDSSNIIGVRNSKNNDDEHDDDEENNINNNNHFDNNNLGLVLEALDNVSSHLEGQDMIYPINKSFDNLHEQRQPTVVDEHDINEQRQQQQQQEDNDQSDDERVEELESEKEQQKINDQKSSGNELLMNVADLMGDLAKKSSASPQSAENESAKLPSEVLLSVDQLSELLADQALSEKRNDSELELANNKVDHFDSKKNETVQSSAGQMDLLGSFTGSGQVDSGDELIAKTSDKFESATTTTTTTTATTPVPGSAPEAVAEALISTSKTTVSGSERAVRKESTFSDLEEPVSPVKTDHKLSSSSSSEEESSGGASQSDEARAKVGAGEESSSQVNVSDDMDSEEQLKLSNHLTNSEDELILAPRNYNYSKLRELSPSRYNEGVGLELMSCEEDRLDSTADLGDGSSAAIESPTTAEKRAVEMCAKVPEISQSLHMFSAAAASQRQGDFLDNDDDDEDHANNTAKALGTDIADLNGKEKDPIDTAATTFN